MWTAALKERSPNQKHFITKVIKQNKKIHNTHAFLQRSGLEIQQSHPKTIPLLLFESWIEIFFPKQGAGNVCSISELLLEIREAGIIFSAAERPGIFQAISQSLLLYHEGHKPTNYGRTQISIVFSSDIHYPSSEKINTCTQKLNKVSSELKV